MPVCTLFCKFKLMLSVMLITASLLMFSTHAEAVEDASPSVLADSAVADTTDSTASDSNSSHYLMQLISGMIVVLLSIVVLAWFAKRMNRFKTSSDGALHILGGISMGARERVVLVQIGEEQLLLGVAPGRINTLHVLKDKLESGAQGADLSDRPATKTFSQYFTDKLQTAVNKNRQHSAGGGMADNV